MSCGGVWRVLTRRKVLDNVSIEKSPLARVLTIGDLTALGVGSTLGVGIYVLAGNVAKESAGPSVVLSFLLAAIASVFAGLCYAEFGARIPRAGSAYVYSYVCVGEFIAFIIGWNLILEYVIGSASVSRGVSLYLDSLLNGTLRDSFREIAPIHSELFCDDQYFDIFACCLAVLIGLALAFGLKESSIVNNIFTLLNLFVVIFVIGAGAFTADIDNWQQPPSQTAGKGGFFPYGFSGTLKGAATCFFGFVGFDCIATTGEEVQNPKRAIPISIVASLFIIFLSYFGISAILTLMVPYYDLDTNAPIPYAFAAKDGWAWAKWVVAIGGIFGLFASLFGSMFPLPRILYAMASDGLIFNFLGTVNSKFKTPIYGTIIASIITGVMAGLFDLKNLVSMMSIGTLMAYTIVAACVLLLRYNCDDTSTHEPDERRSLLRNVENENESSPVCETNRFESENHPDENIESFCFKNKKSSYSCNDIIRQLFLCHCNERPNRLSSVIVGILIALYFVFCFAFGLCLSYTWEKMIDQTIWAIVITSIFGAGMVIIVTLIHFQPKNETFLSFQVPLVPFLPCLSIFINIYLMLMLDANTWIRFGIWMAIGIPVYLICLYIYDRRSNYVPYAQKSSVNGHMKGNLNYAFENMNECQERESDLEISSLKTIMYPPLDKEDDNLKKESNEVIPSNVVDNFSDNIKNGQPVILQNENEDDETNNNVKKDIAINIEDSLDFSEEAIGFLDQVIKNEEEASGVLNDFSEPNDTINSSYPIKQDEDEDRPYFENTIEAINDDSNLEKISTHNVIVLVHREDENIEDESTRIIQINECSELDPVKSPDENGKNDEMKNVTSENNETVMKPELDEITEKVFIPKPPPMDENLFNKPLTQPLFKSKTVNLKKTNIESLTNSQELPKGESTIDNSSIKPNDEFKSQLTALFKNYDTNPKRNLNKGVLKESSMNDAEELEKPKEFKRNKSESNLNNALHLSLLNEIRNSKSKSEDDESPNTKNSNSTLNNITNFDNESKAEKLQDKKNIEQVYDHSDEPKSTSEIKKMLEGVIGKPKPMKIIPKAPKKNAIDNGDPELIADTEILPKTKEDLSKTMKLQRSRFENVLKSIQQSQSRRESTESKNHEINDKIIRIKLSGSEDDDSKTSER